MTSVTGASIGGTVATSRTGRVTAVAALLILTAVLYLWGLGDSGWANSFYTAAAQAGTHSWKALLFGSSDGANAITVDKTPAFLWIIGISVRLFGLNPWSVLVPQAVEGVAAVGVLYAAARRTGGHAAGLIAGAVLALTPVAVLMFRFNNPDALMVLLLVAAAYCVTRAVESASPGWLVACGAAMGTAFLAKELQAFVVLPAFAAVYLVAAPTGLRRRVLHLLAAAAATAAAAGWYLALVALWPASARPYIGGSQHDSVLELVLGYNGVGRITGDEPGGLGNTDAEAGWGRLFDAAMGDQIAWLIPAAAVLTAAALWILRRRPRTDPRRAALLLWGGWLLVAGVVLSFAAGIVHPYYTVQLAPAIAGLLGIAAPLVWAHRAQWWARSAAAAAVCATAVLSAGLLLRSPHWLPWLAPLLVVGGIVVAVLIVALPQLTGILAAATGGDRAGAAGARTLAAAAAASALAAPGMYSVATAALPHRGAIPTAGPSDPRSAVRHRSTLLQAAPAGRDMVRLLRTDADDYTWAAATIGSNPAAGLQLSSGLPVMAVGGYNGTDPFPTLDGFRNLVAEGRIHYFVGSPADGFSILGTIDPLLPMPAVPGLSGVIPSGGAVHAPGAPAIDPGAAGRRGAAPWIPLPGTRPPARAPAHRPSASATPGDPTAGSTATRITEWVSQNYRAHEVDGLPVYDLSASPRAHPSPASPAVEEVP